MLLTVFGPISMDLYLPVLPALTTELGSVTSAAQLTVSACLIGLAVGQVVAGLALEVSTSTVCRSVLTPPGPGGHPSVGGS
jgi:MFS family permease